MVVLVGHLWPEQVLSRLEVPYHGMSMAPQQINTQLDNIFIVRDEAERGIIIS
jgi:hypothetical protein